MIMYLLEVSEKEVKVEGERGNEVDDVDRSTEERQFTGADDESDEQLEGEPAVTDTLNVKECVVWDCTALVKQPGRCSSDRHITTVAGASNLNACRQTDVLDRRNSHVWMSLEAEREDRNNDEKHRQS